ncbi:DNA ligase [Pseudomonas phage vB_PpuM-Voja-6]
MTIKIGNFEVRSNQWVCHPETCNHDSHPAYMITYRGKSYRNADSEEEARKLIESDIASGAEKVLDSLFHKGESIYPQEDLKGFVWESVAQPESTHLKPSPLSFYEKEVVSLLAEAWNKFMLLPEEHPNDRQTFCDRINELQNMVMCRPVRRIGWTKKEDV